LPGRRHRPPEVRPTAFTARLPDLPPRSLMALDFAITCSLVRPGRPRYPVLVHQAAASLHASFRRRLAAMPLRFANPSPPSGWIEDFHLQAVVHARHTRQSPGRTGTGALRGPLVGHGEQAPGGPSREIFTTIWGAPLGGIRCRPATICLRDGTGQCEQSARRSPQ
jgi:hypothetical protein